MKIIISGLTASGKSTLVAGLSNQLDFSIFSGSSKLREFMPPKLFDFWESKKGLDALKFRLAHTKYDRRLDDYILEYAKNNDNFILDSWTASWRIKDDAIKIYLKADLKIRAARVSERDQIPFASAIKFMKEKDKLSIKIYKKLYNISIDTDTAPFDLVIDSGTLSISDLRDLCLDYIRKRQIN
jgi:cytidylate kinase